MPPYEALTSHYAKSSAVDLSCTASESRASSPALGDGGRVLAIAASVPGLGRIAGLVRGTGRGGKPWPAGM